MHVSPSILSPFSSDSESRRSDSRSAISYLQGLVDRSPREETGSRARSVALERRKRPTKLSRISRGPLETITTQPAPTNEEQPRLYVHCEEKEAIRSRNFVLARLKIILYTIPCHGRHEAPGSRTLPKAGHRADSYRPPPTSTAKQFKRMHGKKQCNISVSTRNHYWTDKYRFQSCRERPSLSARWASSNMPDPGARITLLSRCVGH